MENTWVETNLEMECGTDDQIGHVGNCCEWTGLLRNSQISERMCF